MTRRVPGWACALALGYTALLVGAPAELRTYAAGRTYFGRNAYVEFRAGALPVIISAPHGGTLDPVEIPNRTSGTTVTDIATEDLARAVAAALQVRSGREPSLVICRLKRSKVDVNRDVGEGAQGNARAEQAWHEYHGFLDGARAIAAGRDGRALVVDLHGHGHAKPRIEIGYLLGADDLNRPDVDLDDPAWARQSSIRTLAAEAGVRFSALVRGPVSLGGLLERAGHASVPSPSTPGPGTDPFFGGGYTTRRHGSADGGPVSAVQLETPYPALRDSPAARSRFASSLADVLLAYVSAHVRHGVQPFSVEPARLGLLSGPTATGSARCRPSRPPGPQQALRVSARLPATIGVCGG